MNVLIIGAAGFVGGYLIQHLAGDAARRDAAHRDVLITATKLPHEQIDTSSCRVLDIDILCEDAVRSLIEAEQPEAVYHLAAQSSVSLSWENPGLTADVNIKGTINLLEALRKTGCKSRVLLIGSGEEYGKVSELDNPINENAQIRPSNIYAATKACQNVLGRIYHKAYGMDVVMVRAFNHAGPGQSPVFVVSDFCSQIAQIEAGKKEPVIYTGNLSVRRDFTDVRDIVRAYASLMRAGKKGNVYNVGTGKAVAISEILKIATGASTVNIKIKTDAAKFRPADVPVIEADISKITADTGWYPEISLEQTIIGTLQYWRNKIQNKNL